MSGNDAAPMSAHDIVVDLNETDITKSVTFEVEDTRSTESSEPDETSTPKRKKRTRQRRESPEVSMLVETVKRQGEQLNEFINESRTEKTQAKVSALEDKIRRVRADIKQAQADENDEAADKLQDQLVDLLADKKVAERQKPETNEQRQSADERPQAPQLARELMAKNPQFFRNPAYAEDLGILQEIDKNLALEGTYSTDEEEYYEELMKRVSKRLPHVEFKLPEWLESDDEGEQMDTKPTKESPTKPAGSTRTNKASGSKVRITAEDRAQMSRLGLNPNDPETVRMYAQNKLKSAGA